MNAIPVIDLAPAREGGRADRLRVARRIDAACCEIGFFTITGHGVRVETISDRNSLTHVRGGRYFLAKLS